MSAPGDQRNISVGISNFSSPMILERELTTFQSCSQLVRGILSVSCKKIWFAATWPVQRLPFLHSDELAWKACFHRIGLDSCGMDQAIRRSLPWNNIFTKPSERCRVPIDILNHTGKAFREMLGSEMEASSMHSTSVSENLRVLLVCTPAHMGCYDISIVTRYFKSWICICMLSCKIGDSGSSMPCYFQMKRGNCIGTRRILVFKRRIYYSEAFCVQRCFDWFLQFFWGWSFRTRTGCELYTVNLCVM